MQRVQNKNYVVIHNVNESLVIDLLQNYQKNVIGLLIVYSIQTSHCMQLSVLEYIVLKQITLMSTGDNAAPKVYAESW